MTDLTDFGTFWRDLPERSTPINQATLNGREAKYKALAIDMQAQVDRAEQAAEAALAPTDAQVADLIADPTSATGQAARVAAATGRVEDYVQLPRTTTAGTDPGADSLGTTLLGILRGNAKYNLGTWWAANWAAQDGEQYLTFTGVNEHDIRPACCAVFGLGALLGTGAWDQTATGQDQETGLARTVRLVTSLAHRHAANAGDGLGWGYQWQSALWSAQAGCGAWLIWDTLDATARHEIATMIAAEADNPYWAHPLFWKSPAGVELRPGDSAAEELAWMAMNWQLATAMMPRHPHVATWRAQMVAFNAAAWSGPVDLGDPSVIDGYSLGSMLAGWNVNPDGTVVNHARIHPDYMAAATLNLHGVITASLAGQPTSPAVTNGIDRVWAALVQRNFTTAEGYNSPGGTIYVSGSANLYYPQGNDWSGAGLSTRVLDKGVFDLMVSLLGMDRGVTPNGATWAALHLNAVKTLQARSTTGQVYQGADEDTYPNREQWISMNAGLGWLVKYAVNRGLYSADLAGRTASAGRLRTLTGTVTLPAPATTLKTSATVNFGVRFLTPPTVTPTTPITSTGVRVSAFAVNVTETGCEIRYVGTAAASDVTAQWVATGLVP